VNQYKLAAGGNKALPMFGVASQSLADYLTSEKDLARKICRMPTEEYIMQGEAFGEPTEETKQEAGGDNEDFEDDDFDDFVMLDKPEVQNSKYN